MVSKYIFGGASLVGAIIVLVAVIVGWMVVPKIIDNRIEEEVRLVKGSDTWEKWTNITLPIRLKFNVFHVTNPDQVELGDYPIFEEKGPYVYVQKRTKEQIKEKSGTVFYTQRITYTFSEEESIGPDTDAYNVVNVALVSVLDSVNKVFPTLIEGVVNYIGNQSHNVIMRGVSVRDLTFDGYDISAFNHPLLTGSYPPEFTDDWRFGLYETKNGTVDGRYQINSGIDASSRFGEIIQWNGKTRLGYYDGVCDEISGSDGSIFPPFVTKETVLNVFTVDMCRSLYMTYVREDEVRGIKGYTFSTPPSVLEDPRTNAANQCFCLKSNVSECDYGGVLDVSPCRGAPILMSTPHFLGGHPTYLADSGLSPDPEAHRTFITLEPNTGVLLKANKRIQVNIRLTPYDTPGTTMFSNVPEMIFPIFWAEETVQITEESAKDVEDKLLKPVKALNIAKWTVLGIGIAIAVVGFALLVLKK